MFFFKKKPTQNKPTESTPPANKPVEQSQNERIQQLIKDGKLDTALNLCRDICHASNATARDWLLYGHLSADAGDLSKARKAFRKAIELDSDLSDAHFGLGKAMASVGDYMAAIQSLQTATQLQPDNAEIWTTLGITYGISQQLIKAEECCRQAIALQPNSANGHFNLGNALQGQGKLDEAEIEYEAAVNLEPTLVAAWSMLAQTRVGLRNFEEAKIAATQAMTLAPHMGEAIFTLGSIAQLTGDNEQARDYFRRAIELLPRLPDAHTRLGQVLFQLGNFTDAIASLQNTLRINPAAFGAHFILGNCFNELGKYDEAIGHYQRAIEINNNHLRSHYSLALLFGNLGRHAEATKHLEEILRINPNDDQAKHLLAAYKGQTTTTAPAAYVSTLFDGFADTFDKKLVTELEYHIPEIIHERIQHFIPTKPTTLDVIDLGCGTGLCAPLFRTMARTIHGVDLSPKMIEKARERGLYNTLEVNDVASSLKARTNAWDLALSTDVFVYIGDLSEIFTACAAALRPGGMFAFSIEADDNAETFTLRTSGRYAHASNYIRSLASQVGLNEIERHEAVIRKDKGHEIDGYIFVLQKPTNIT